MTKDQAIVKAAELAQQMVSSSETVVNGQNRMTLTWDSPPKSAIGNTWQAVINSLMVILGK